MADDKSKTGEIPSSERKRAYNSSSMNERRASILAATLAIIEESGLQGVTIRAVSKKSGVALRTLYLYFNNRESMIGVAIKEYFYNSISTTGVDSNPKNIHDVLKRFDVLSDIVISRREYSSALAPIYFSNVLHSEIYEILRGIALSHVTPFLDDLTSSGRNKLSPQAKDFLFTQISNIQYSVIEDALSGRMPEKDMSSYLKISVISFIEGFLPKPPAEFKKILSELRSSIE